MIAVRRAHSLTSAASLATEERVWAALRGYCKMARGAMGGPRSSDCVSPATYSTTPYTVGPGPGVTGGAITIGGRSFTIFSWAPGEKARTEGRHYAAEWGSAALHALGREQVLTEVFDSGDIMEQLGKPIAVDSS